MKKFILSCILFIAFTACSDKPVPESSSVNLTKTELIFDAKGGEETIVTGECKQQFCESKKDSCKNNGENRCGKGKGQGNKTVGCDSLRFRNGQKKFNGGWVSAELPDGQNKFRVCVSENKTGKDRECTIQLKRNEREETCIKIKQAAK